MKSVRLRDISPRLAFQAHSAPTEQKVELVDRLTAAGMRAIEVSSFVHPKMVPGLADAEKVFAQVKRRDGISLECCVGNLTGLKRAIDSGAHVAWFLLAADEQFSKANIGRSIDESLAELESMVEVAASAGITLGTYLIALFGGPTGLSRNPEDVRGVASRLIDLGVSKWILADSCGYAAPPQIRKMVRFATEFTDITNLNVQVHDSRGMGLANIAELVNLGLANIDTSLAGSGGHPAAPGAHVGGTCTEDTAQMLSLMDIETGLDLPALIETANWLTEVVGVNGKGFTRMVGNVPKNAHELAQFQSTRGAFNWNAN